VDGVPARVPWSERRRRLESSRVSMRRRMRLVTCLSSASLVTLATIASSAPSSSSTAAVSAPTAGPPPGRIFASKWSTICFWPRATNGVGAVSMGESRAGEPRRCRPPLSPLVAGEGGSHAYFHGPTTVGPSKERGFEGRSSRVGVGSYSPSMYALSSGDQPWTSPSPLKVRRPSPLLTLPLESPRLDRPGAECTSRAPATGVATPARPPLTCIGFASAQFRGPPTAEPGFELGCELSFEPQADGALDSSAVLVPSMADVLA